MKLSHIIILFCHFQSIVAEISKNKISHVEDEKKMIKKSLKKVKHSEKAISKLENKYLRIAVKLNESIDGISIIIIKT